MLCGGEVESLLPSLLSDDPCNPAQKKENGTVAAVSSPPPEALHGMGSGISTKIWNVIVDLGDLTFMLLCRAAVAAFFKSGARHKGRHFFNP